MRISIPQIYYKLALYLLLTSKITYATIILNTNTIKLFNNLKIVIQNIFMKIFKKGGQKI